MSHPGLTAKQLAFAQEYVRNGGRPTDAYRAAGYSTNGNTNVVRVNACRLAQKPKVAAKISELRTLAAEAPVVLDQGDQQVLIDSKRIIFENSRLAFSDVRRLFNADGTMKEPREWDADMAAAVQSIETRALFAEGVDGKRQIGFVHKIKLWDKSAALERLMRHLGMFEKDSEKHNPNSVLTDGELLAKLKIVCKRLGIPVPPIRLIQSG